LECTHFEKCEKFLIFIHCGVICKIKKLDSELQFDEKRSGTLEENRVKSGWFFP
jgi:hypothetical protein